MTTPLHVAETISEELATRMAACRTSLGAETNLGTTVYRGRRRIDDNMLPCSVLIEGDDIPSRERGPYASVKLEQRYVLLAYVPCDPDHPNVAAHAAIRDMKRALYNTGGKPDERLGGKVLRLHYLGREIAPRGDGAAFTVAAIEVAVEYAESLAAP